MSNEDKKLLKKLLHQKEELLKILAEHEEAHREALNREEECKIRLNELEREYAYQTAREEEALCTLDEMTLAELDYNEAYYDVEYTDTQIMNCNEDIEEIEAEIEDLLAEEDE